MDELYRELLEAKIYEKAFYLLADAILEYSELDYSGEHLRIDEDDPAYSVIKAFYNDGYRTRLNELKSEREARFKKIDEITMAIAEKNKEA